MTGCQEVAASRRFRFQPKGDSAASTKAPRNKGVGCSTMAALWRMVVFRGYGIPGSGDNHKNQMKSRDGSLFIGQLAQNRGGTMGVQSVNLDSTQDDMILRL